MTDKTISERVVELSYKLENAMREKAPEAWDAALRVIQLEAVQTLIWAVFGAVAAVIGVLLAFRWGRAAYAIVQERGQRYARDEEVKYAVGSFFSTVGAFLGVVVLSGALNIWTYIALAQPELIIAKRVLQGLLYNPL